QYPSRHIGLTACLNFFHATDDVRRLHLTEWQRTEFTKRVVFQAGQYALCVGLTPAAFLVFPPLQSQGRKEAATGCLFCFHTLYFALRSRVDTGSHFKS